MTLDELMASIAPMMQGHPMVRALRGLMGATQNARRHAGDEEVCVDLMVIEARASELIDALAGEATGPDAKLALMRFGDPNPSPKRLRL